MTSAPGIEQLAALSARLGAEPALVQGSGGNTSIKLGDVLWVKASGKWLADAACRPTFVPLDLPHVRRSIQAGLGEQLTDAVIGEAGGLRPSIETTLHAIMPHAVVLHLHSLGVLSWAVRADAERCLSALLGGLRWALVPYRRPGLSLTETVGMVVAGRPIDVLVLANHGLVLGGADVESADSLLAEVERRVAPTVRTFAPADVAGLGALANGTAYRLPADPVVHALALDPMASAVARGSLYPDHVVFLGPGLRVEPDPGRLPCLDRSGRGLPAVLVIPGSGTLVRCNLAAAAEAMVNALASLTLRLSPEAPLRYLTAADEASLLGWDAEHYRQSLIR